MKMLMFVVAVAFLAWKGCQRYLAPWGGETARAGAANMNGDNDGIACATQGCR
jgi:hypothetical protein